MLLLTASMCARAGSRSSLPRPFATEPMAADEVIAPANRPPAVPGAEPNRAGGDEGRDPRRHAEEQRQCHLRQAAGAESTEEERAGRVAHREQPEQEERVLQ